MNPALRVLIVENDADDIELLAEAFQATIPSPLLQFFTDSRTTVQYLHGCADEDLPDLIISDYNLPIMNGEDLLQTLASEKRYQHIPKVILSTSGSQRTIENCLAKGAARYIVKPSSFIQLTEIARETISLCTEKK